MNGYLLIDKESGYTSFDVVAKLRGILKTKKLGHTGTLDPNATGLLVVLAGAGTKAVPLLEHHTKTYEATLLLGKRTDTEDIWGEVLEEKEFPTTLDEEKVTECLDSFLGKRMQVPPMYSAKKINGKKLYDLAREGKTVERKAVPIEILEIKLLGISLPEIKFSVTCSAGTYIRTLCTEIAEKLGTIGCMSSLRRTRVGDFRIEDAVFLSKVNTDTVYPLDGLFISHAACVMQEKADRFLQNGNPITFDEVMVYRGSEKSILVPGEKFIPEENEGSIYRMYFSNEKFAGLYIEKDGQLVPYKMMFSD